MDITPTTEPPPDPGPTYPLEVLCSVCGSWIRKVEAIYAPDGPSHGLCADPACKQAVLTGDFSAAIRAKADELRAAVERAKANLAAEVRHEVGS